ncbi:HET-domain-containing protein [Leucogyrophana mollusca]|uniref:HET-domain-containing protein n=1 Tax=Leucogyrophana mollusca TaxID=85980 RepID=A0ACB8BCW9_9AGAM|nr:HET-domain-containing protein [Leucogyrophana mollusca]
MVEEKTRYAILSHTWGKDELNYKDMKKGRNLDMKKNQNLVGVGYEKLEKFCEVASKNYEVTFAWADTVCIDKSSSAELDESIRSMFKWYANAYICIAYLADTTSREDMSSDRWFKRGWTLQEYLAPRRIKFYARNWMPLTSFCNDKRRWRYFMGAMERATGVSRGYLDCFNPGVHEDLAVRMAWVARRETTRAEDKAYCMMGIFGISMSIAYGEGPQHAFCRLIKAILDISGNGAIFTWAGEPVDPSVHPSRMLPSSPACYLSQHELLREFTPQPAEASTPPTLTSKGLRMKALVAQADIVSPLVRLPQSGSLQFIAKFRCDLAEEIITAIIYQPADGRYLDGRDSEGQRSVAQFALVVWKIGLTVSSKSRPCPLCSGAHMGCMLAYADEGLG